MEVPYALETFGYCQTFHLQNTGERDMPLTFGLHTVFAEPLVFRTPIGQRWEQDACYVPTGRLLPLTEEEETYLRGTAFCGKLIRGCFTSARQTTHMGDYLYTVSPQFDQWVLWNGDGRQGFCAIEPLCGAVNALNSGQGLLRLAPGEKVSFSTRIHLAV